MQNIAHYQDAASFALWALGAGILQRACKEVGVRRASGLRRRCPLGVRQHGREDPCLSWL